MYMQAEVSTINQTHQGTAFSYRYLVAGFNLLAAFQILMAFFPSQGFSFEKVVISGLLMLAVLCFALQIRIGLIDFYFNKFIFPSNILLTLLFVWCLITIARGIESDTTRLFTLIANPGIGGLVWLLPFAVYIGRQPGVLQALLPTFRLHAIIGIILVVWTFANIGSAGAKSSGIGLALFYAAPVVLLTGIGCQLDRWIYTTGLGLSVITHYLLSNRAACFVSLVFLILTLTFRKDRDFNTVVFLAKGLAAIAVAVLVLASVDNVLSMLSDDWFVDTRTFLWEEMNADFGVQDWIIGRGALGTYYSPYFDFTGSHDLGGDSKIRQVNEIGYLHIALKAGLIGVLLYSLTIALATYKSIFLPNKRFAVALTLLLSSHLLEMAVVGQASVEPSRVLLWMMVGLTFATPLKQV